jgi:O-antigen ligase
MTTALATPEMLQSAPYGHAVEGPQRKLLMLAGLLWAGLAGFSHLFDEKALLMQGLSLGVGVALVALSLGTRGGLAWLRAPVLWLLAAHVAAAITSGLIRGSEAADLLRTAALLPALAALVALARAAPAGAAALRVGMTWAGVVFVAFHLRHLDFSSLLDPRYRLSVFLNPNSTGFIAAMTAVSALELGWTQRRIVPRLGWLGVAGLGALLCFSTKSRTALAAGLAGGFVVAWLRASRPLLRWGLVAAMGGLVFLAMRALPPESVVETLSLDDRDRSILSGTGRYEVWRLVLWELWPRHPLLGLGPGLHGEEVIAATGISSAHNGLLMALAETGLLGTIPLALILALCFRQCWRQRRHADPAAPAGLFAAGVAESLGEVMLFSMGNPGSLLFLWAVARLGSGPVGRPKSPAGEGWGKGTDFGRGRLPPGPAVDPGEARQLQWSSLPARPRCSTSPAECLSDGEPPGQAAP